MSRHSFAVDASDRDTNGDLAPLHKRECAAVIAMLAARMLCERKARLIFTAAGMACLFFLGIAQTGMLVGWMQTISAIITRTGVQLWVMAEKTSAFDYGSPIPRQRLYQVRSVAGVASAEPIVATWSVWQCPDGRRVNVEVIGVDRSGAGGPWRMAAGNADALNAADSVVVDELFLALLGVSGPGDEAELFGRRAIVRGLSQDVRSFTAAPFVFSSIQSARKYDARYADDEITYVLVRCHDPTQAEKTALAIQRAVPSVEVLTSEQFAQRSIAYWMLGTGIGITVMITAGLALLVAALVGGQTLFAITNDHLSDYGALLAIGFDPWQLICAVILQSLLLSSTAALIGSAGFTVAAIFTARTAVPLEMTPLVYFAILALCFAAGAAGSLLSINTVLRLDPVIVFRG